LFIFLLPKYLGNKIQNKNFQGPQGKKRTY